MGLEEKRRLRQPKLSPVSLNSSSTCLPNPPLSKKNSVLISFSFLLTYVPQNIQLFTRGAAFTGFPALPSENSCNKNFDPHMAPRVRAYDIASHCTHNTVHVSSAGIHQRFMEIFQEHRFPSCKGKITENGLGLLKKDPLAKLPPLGQFPGGA